MTALIAAEVNSVGWSPFDHKSQGAVAGGPAVSTPLPLGAPNTRLVWLSALAQAATLTFANPDNAASSRDGWAQDLGHEERATNPSGARPAAVDSEVPQFALALQKARETTSRSRAYSAFEEVLSSHDITSPLVEVALATYLVDPTNAHRDALLGCLADRETELSSGALLTAVGQLLAATDARTRRMAALALSASGPSGETELGRGLDALSLEWAEDIRQTLRWSA